MQSCAFPARIDAVLLPTTRTSTCLIICFKLDVEHAVLYDSKTPELIPAASMQLKATCAASHQTQNLHDKLTCSEQFTDAMSMWLSRQGQSRRSVSCRFVAAFKV